MELQRDALVEAAEDAGQHADHQRGDAHAKHDADHARRERVRGALEQEHLREVPSLEADGTAHAHLRSALGREHHEDEKDEQDTDRDGKEAHAQERARDEQPASLREHHGVGLVRGVDVEIEPAGNVVVARQPARGDRSDDLGQLGLEIRISDERLEAGADSWRVKLGEHAGLHQSRRGAGGQRFHQRFERSAHVRLRQQGLELGRRRGVDLQHSHQLEELVWCLAGPRHGVAHDAVDQLVAGERFEFIGDGGLVQLNEKVGAEVLCRVEERSLVMNLLDLRFDRGCAHVGEQVSRRLRVGELDAKVLRDLVADGAGRS